MTCPAVPVSPRRIAWGATIALLIGALLTSCTTQPDATAADDPSKPNIVSTSTMIADWTQQVGGDRIDHTSLLKPGTDPHVYEPVPADSLAIEQADLIFYNGYNLEPGLIKMINASGQKARRVAVGEIISPLSFDYQGTKEPDPHVWGDAKNAIAIVKLIRDELIQLSPEDQAQFTANANRLIAELEQVDRWIEQQIQTIPPDRRRLVTTHDAFQYYARAYGLEVLGTLIGISTEEQPSANTVQTLANAIKAAKVPAIFAETTINPALIRTVAQEAGVKLADCELYSDSLSVLDGEAGTYVQMLVTNTRTIVEALGGKYTPFEFKAP